MSSYLKFLSRNKLYTAIEFIGLSVALAFVIISFCYVVQQYAVTRENPDRERIYAVGADQMTNGYGMKELIADKLPEVESVTHFFFSKEQSIKIGDELYVSDYLYCDREFFDFFPVKFKEGNADHFTESNIAFISEKLASKIEGEIIGRQLIAGKDTLNVAGVFSTLGSSLLLDADLIANIATCKNVKPFRDYPIYNMTYIHTFLEEGSGWITESTVVGMTGLPYGDYNFDEIMSWANGKGVKDICGVIKDFNMLDALHATDEDYSIVFANGHWLSLKLTHFLLDIVGDHDEAKRAIDAVYEKHCKTVFGAYVEPYNNDFVKNVIAKKYDKTRRQMRLIELIMGISVMLALLGLVAMSTHFASEREKGIAIRKVFGGTMESEIRRNLKEYIVMILIANVIAIPVAIWLCGRYLEDFAYRIPTYWWIFAVAAVLSFVIAIGSVIWQIVSVSKVNPA